MSFILEERESISFRILISKGFDAQESKQEVTKVASLAKQMENPTIYPDTIINISGYIMCQSYTSFLKDIAKMRPKVLPLTYDFIVPT